MAMSGSDSSNSLRNPTFEGSQAAALEIRRLPNFRSSLSRISCISKFKPSYSLRLGDAFGGQTNSPLLVMLQFVDPDVLGGDDFTPLQEDYGTPLHDLAYMADLFEYSTHENQLILAKQLIAHGANVNTVMIPMGEILLHCILRDQPRVKKAVTDVIIDLSTN